MSDIEYHNWHDKFCLDYGVNWKLTKMRSLLEEANILNVESTGSTLFKYPYIYYFFLAKRLSRGLSEKDVCETVERMCQRLHITEYANVILFLIHHSDNPLVLESVRSSASSLMCQQQLFTFEPSDSNELLFFINRLPSHKVTQRLEDRDPEKEQQRALKKKDVLDAKAREREKSTSEEFGSKDDSMEALDTLAQASVAVKTIDLLGVILKNYYGSLILNAKVNIGKEAVDLAFRSLFSFVELFVTQNGAMLIDTLVEARREFENNNLETSQRKNNQELESWARMFVFSITRCLARAIVQKVARAIGSNQLRPTLKKLVDDHDSIGYRLVEIAVLLDTPSNIPRRKIKKLADRLKNNTFGFQVLRDLAAHRVYRYPIEFDDKQWLASTLDFSLASQRLADLDKSKRLLAS